MSDASNSSVFKVGQVVRLKSGGPDMTVQLIGGDLVYCVWFNIDGEQRTGAYLVPMLEPAAVGDSAPRRA